jgi:fluoride exporter
MSSDRTFYVNLLLIAIGGALGSVARYLFSSFVLRVTGSLLPIGTFAVNILGCVVFGGIAGAAAQQRLILTPEARGFLLIGVLGGFTTFSSYAYESFLLMRDGQFAAAAFNIVGQVVAALVGMWAAYVITN